MVLYVSECWVGKTHDYSMFKQEFPPGQDWFKNFTVRVGLGFLGIDKDYACKRILLPHKKKKNQELDGDQIKENRSQACGRISVEHAIGGMKRYRVLSDRLRIHDVKLYNDILGICAGLWNFYLSN